MMADAGLSGVEHNYPGEVSSGMRRRVEIVRALMNDPKALLLDEPYRALDSLTKSVMHEALLEIYYKNKVTIFFITHDLEEAIFLGHRVAIMTTRPCKPKKVLDVDIPHPRDYSVLTSKRFRELIEETNDAVHEEALQGLPGRREGRMRDEGKILSSPRLLARRGLDRRVPRPLGDRRALEAMDGAGVLRAVQGAARRDGLQEGLPALDRRGARALGGAQGLGRGARPAGLLAELVHELVPRHGRLHRRDDHRHPVRPAARGEPRRARHRLPGVRGAAADPAARLGAGVDHLLADAGARRSSSSPSSAPSTPS